MQLQLIQDTTQSYLATILDAESISWANALHYADNIEHEIDNKEVYQNVLGINTREFFKLLGNKATMYRLAIKAVWWHRLVCTDKNLTWFQQKDMAEKGFFTHFGFLEYSRRQHKYILNQGRLAQARIQWALVKKKYPSCKKNELNNYALKFEEAVDAEQSELLRDRIEELERNLEDATNGSLIYYGIACNNKDIPPDYLELYCMGRKSSMNALQFKEFVNLMFLKGKYAACNYLTKFQLYEEYQH